MADLTAGIPVRHDGTLDPDLIDRAVAPYLSRDVSDLAPGVQDAVNAALCRCDQQGHSVIILETYRSDDVERAYWRKGRDRDGKVVRADEIVTHAVDGAHSWHCYHLAFDLSGVTNTVAAIVAGAGFSWGGAWVHSPDRPHFQWGKCPASPTVQDVADYRAGRLGNVWLRYEAGA